MESPDIRPIVVSTALIIAFVSYVFKSKPFSGPGACGLGLASITAILGLGISTMSSVDDLFAFSAKGIPFYAVSSFVFVMFMLAVAGYSASMTRGDTVTMNVKIVMAVGIIPFIFISLMSFSNISLWFVLACLVVYAPTIWGGHVFFNHRKSKFSDH